MALAGISPFVMAKKVLQLLCAIGLPLLSFRGNTGSATVNADPTLEGSVESSGTCWIYTHLQKSGGSTVKGILKDKFRGGYSIYDNPHWKKGDGHLQSVGRQLAGNSRLKVVAGGYTEALRHSSAADQTCQWFTMFRHPISRIVSAYYYCKQAPGDGACASGALNAKTVDIVTFAKHWGNFALRQFALGMVPVNDIIEYSRTDAARKTLTPRKRREGWYLFKVYLNDLAKESEYGDIPDVAMYEMLQPVKDLLRDRYTVGILEEFNATLSLFDAALGIPGIDWHAKFAGEGKVKVDQMYKIEEAAALVEAWTNSDIKQYMELDLVLYEHAVDVFRQQTRAYGI